LKINMKPKFAEFLTHFSSYNWQSVIAVMLATIYLTSFLFMVSKTKFPAYGKDFLAFWSAGKIANEFGYSQTYDLETLRYVEARELENLGVMVQSENLDFSPIPAPYLSLFILPFQLLSRINIVVSSSLWLIINLVTLSVYLLILYRSYFPKGENKKTGFFDAFSSMLLSSLR